ncbi:hypothetical protein FDT66_05395 [Polaribacter aestuariivivens]|uniref:Lycopene cyclase domain-containing protein n=1 Tax=Polaribacter aestuariivivens TaxID=2304626 RepID=A0A5S3N7U8_9FLAO|nr:lycopene cyclase domain-containing protein [Polaribacter aestuariivivens]TMM31400.1 hypothetical protein FDT66_05395 [Polaribacter aestuariivivens]
MQTYSYFLLGVFLAIPWVLIFYFKKNLRRRMLIASTIGAPFAFINSWFRIDYWNPPELFFFHIMSIEDILFAFTTTGISVTIFDALFTEKQVQTEKPRTTLSYIFIPFIILSFFFLHNYLGINSMFMWAIPMIFLAIVVVIMRNDLFIPSLFSAILSMLIAIPIYIILFNYISPNYWDKYWYLNGTAYDTSILGNVPLMELLWYFSWGCFSGVMYDFARGTKKIPNKLWKKITNI